MSWAFKKSKGFGFPSTFFAKEIFSTAKYYQKLSYYLFSLLCHEHSKKVKALASLHRFMYAKKILSMAKYYQKLSSLTISCLSSLRLYQRIGWLSYITQFSVKFTCFYVIFLAMQKNCLLVWFLMKSNEKILKMSIWKSE